MPKKHRKMKGGEFSDSVGSSFNNLASALTNDLSFVCNEIKDNTNKAYYRLTGTPQYNSLLSGGKRKTRRHMRGGFKDNNYTTGLASTASPISNIKTAQPHNWVGGKTSRRRHVHSKSCKHRKH